MRHRFFFLMLISALTFICLRMLNTLTAVAFWLAEGQPDFYFRGWSGVQVSLQTDWVIGIASAIPFGLLLFLFERIAGRSVRLVPLILILSILSLSFFIAITGQSFAGGQIVTAFCYQFLGIPLVGLILAVLCSQKIVGDHRE